MPGADSDRKRHGAWLTPEHLVDLVVDAVVTPEFVASRAGRRMRVIDPSCGDGRFLVAVGAAVRALGGEVELVGVDVDPRVLSDVDAASGIVTVCDDSLTSEWLTRCHADFDLVIGNPPYLSQLSAITARGGASGRGGGPYADAAVEFLALAAELVDPAGGRVAFVLPQSILSSRDAGDVRVRIDRRAEMFWSSWTGERDFDAQVVTCALAFEFGRGSNRSPGEWSHVVTRRAGVPPMPDVFDADRGPMGRLGDRVRFNANFRDEYYGMVPAVGDHADGPPLVTSGLIDPGRCRWGEVPVRFAKHRYAAPRIDLARLDPKMRAWAEQRLVPKVLVANQTAIVEAVCDPDGRWLPGVPVVAAYPESGPGAVDVAWQVAAILTSPSVSVWAWHQRGGTGLSSSTIRLGPTLLAGLAWPTGPVDSAVAALRAGDVVECGRSIDVAYGLTSDERSAAAAWWGAALERILTRRP